MLLCAPGACHIISPTQPLPITSNPSAVAGASTPVTRRVLPMVLAALVIRLVVMVLLLPDQLLPSRAGDGQRPALPPHFHMGFEAGRIGYSIVEGRGFSSPLFGETGPTAWLTPIYPYIIAGTFKIFGTYSTASAVALLSLNALASSLLCIVVFLIARRSFGERVAIWSRWGWAFCPYGIYFPVERIWETYLAALILGLLFLITLHLEDESRLSCWAGFGALWGLGALTSPVMLSALPFLAAWLIYRRHRRGRRWFLVNVVATLAFLVVVAPWVVRNYTVFHRFIPLRDNMGLALRCGTKGKSDYWGPYELGPWNSNAEWNEFQQVGELAYMDHKKEQAIAFIRAHPGWYVWTSFRRAFFMWTGYWSLDRAYLEQEPLDPPNILFCSAFTVLALLGLRRACKQDFGRALPYLLLLVSLPVLYYVSVPEVYYRRPLDPFLVILAVAGLMPRGAATSKKGATPSEKLSTVP